MSLWDCIKSVREEVNEKETPSCDCCGDELSPAEIEGTKGDDPIHCYPCQKGNCEICGEDTDESVKEAVDTETSDVEFEQYLWGEDLEGLRNLGNSPRMEVWRSKLSPSQQQILQTVLKRKELGENKNG